jgi:hypothetical protein
MEMSQRKFPGTALATIDTEKHILTIFVSTRGPLIEDWLPTNASFHRTSICKVIVRRLARAAFPDQAGQRKRRVDLEMANAKPHNSNIVTPMSR